MIVYHKHMFSLMILYAVILHIAWAVCAWVDPSAVNSTALAAVHDIFGTLGTPLVCLGVALAALAAFRIEEPYPALLLMLPQQAIMTVSALGAAHAIYISQFADGVLRPRGFIAADQLPAIIGAVGHTIAVVHAAIRGRVLWNGR